MELARAARLVSITTGTLPFVPLVAPDSAVTALLTAWFRFQCHGLAERTLSLAGRPFLVCSRCLGIYVGLSLAALLGRPKTSAAARRAWLVLAALAMAIEVCVQEATGHAPVHWLRAATGLALAWPIALMLTAEPAEGPEAAPSSRHPSESTPQTRC